MLENENFDEVFDMSYYTEDASSLEGYNSPKVSSLGLITISCNHSHESIF